MKWLGQAQEGRSRIPKKSTQLLVLHLDSKRPVLTLLDRVGTRWQSNRHIELTVDHEEPHQAALGESLLEALDKAEIAARDMIVSVPLSRLLLKHFSLPFVGTDEIAGTIALEAEARDLTPDRFTVDYDARIDQEQNLIHASVIALPQEIRQEIRLAAEVAKLQLLGIAAAELSLAKHLAASNQNDAPQLIALAHSNHVQLLSVEEQIVTRTLWFARDENPYALSRLVANHSRRFQIGEETSGSATEIKLLALGDGCEQLVSDLNGQSEITAAIPELDQQFVPPTLTSALAEELAGELAGSSASIDFLSPKQSAEVVPGWHKNLRTWGVRAALICVLIFLVFQAFGQRLDGRIRQLRTQISSADLQIADQQDKVEQAQQLARWQASRTNWSEVLPETLEQFPTNERVYLSMIRLEQGDAQPAALRLEGLAREIEDAIDLNRELLEHSQVLDLQPDRIDHVENDPHYRARFAITANVKAAGTSGNTDPEDVE